MASLKPSATIFFLFTLLVASSAFAQLKDQQNRGPSYLKKYIEQLERPDRDKDQKPLPVAHNIYSTECQHKEDVVIAIGIIKDMIFSQNKIELEF